MPFDEEPTPAAKSGKYQVWHRSEDGYTPVGLVTTGNLLGAMVFTMDRIDAPWTDGEFVRALVPDPRSTTIGDVIVNPEGVAHEITAADGGLAFSPIDFPPYQEQKALFAEWTEDYALAKEGDARERFWDAIRNPKPPPDTDRQVNDNHPSREGGIEM